MARHHRQAVHAAPPPSQAQPAPAAPEAVNEAPAAPLALGWRVALAVWALGLGGLALYELAGFAVRVIGSIGR